jgi:ankyrin repeat protein
LLATPDIDVNAAAEMGSTPLSLAVNQGQDAVVCQLLAVRDINVNKSVRGFHPDSTTLIIAAHSGKYAIVQQLLAAPRH